MNPGLPARRTMRAKKSGFERLNSLELLLVVLSVVAFVDCMVIAWLVIRGFGD